MTTVEQFKVLFSLMHFEGAKRNCASTQHLIESFRMNGCNSLQSIVSAMMTFGGLHAPLQRAGTLVSQLMMMKPEDIPAYVNKIEGRIVGYGSGFVKGEPDPIHKEIDAFIEKTSPKHHYSLVELTDAVQAKTKKKIFPNTALYSGFYANIMNIHPHMIPSLAVEARIMAWNQILIHEINLIQNERR